MTLRILLNGAKGNMGVVTANALSAQSDIELVAAIDRDDDLDAHLKNLQPDIAIDFTAAHAAFQNTQTIIKHGVRPIIGTSGLLAEQIADLQTQCAKQQLGGIIAPNFSIGAQLMMKYAQDAAKYLPHVEIIEYHHAGKLDAPSGTAIKTADMIAETRKKIPDAICKETLPGALGARHHNIPIHSVRLPGMLAHQSVIFGDTGQTLTIRHDTITRESFMPGVLLACRKVMGLNTLVYGLDNILK